MDLGLGGQTALVTASSKGIGLACARELAAEGTRIMISSRDEEALAKAAENLGRETSAEVDYCVADISRGEDIENLLARTANRFGGVDVLINNTGGPPPGTFDKFGDAEWQAAFESTLLSLVRTMRGVLPSMRERGHGRIVNIASSSFKQPIDNLILSNAFRTAIAGLSKSLATELAPDGILINTLGPGKIATDRVAATDAGQAERLGISIEEVRSRNEKSIPVGRYGEPEDLARVVAFLASRANTYVTGQAFLVDGGMVKAL